MIEQRLSIVILQSRKSEQSREEIIVRPGKYNNAQFSLLLFSSFLLFFYFSSSFLCVLFLFLSSSLYSSFQFFSLSLYISANFFNYNSLFYFQSLFSSWTNDVSLLLIVLFPNTLYFSSYGQISLHSPSMHVILSHIFFRICLKRAKEYKIIPK